MASTRRTRRLRRRGGRAGCRGAARIAPGAAVHAKPLFASVQSPFFCNGAKPLFLRQRDVVKRFWGKEMTRGQDTVR
eukprot:3496101-Rhodomonas_salina.1